jgi:hypothetical protein
MTLSTTQAKQTQSVLPTTLDKHGEKWPQFKNFYGWVHKEPM